MKAPWVKRLVKTAWIQHFLMSRQHSHFNTIVQVRIYCLFYSFFAATVDVSQSSRQWYWYLVLASCGRASLDLRKPVTIEITFSNPGGFFDKQFSKDLQSILPMYMFGFIPIYFVLGIILLVNIILLFKNGIFHYVRVKIIHYFFRLFASLLLVFMFTQHHWFYHGFTISNMRLMVLVCIGSMILGWYGEWKVKSFLSWFCTWSHRDGQLHTRICVIVLFYLVSLLVSIFCTCWYLFGVNWLCLAGTFYNIFVYHIGPSCTCLKHHPEWFWQHCVCPCWSTFGSVLPCHWSKNPKPKPKSSTMFLVASSPCGSSCCPSPFSCPSCCVRWIFLLIELAPFARAKTLIGVDVCLQTVFFIVMLGMLWYSNAPSLFQYIHMNEVTQSEEQKADEENEKKGLVASEEPSSDKPSTPAVDGTHKDTSRVSLFSTLQAHSDNL